MRILRRNSTVFDYRAYIGTEETLVDGLHTGNTKPVYDDPVPYRGNISAPSGFATDNLFGVNTQYTHVLVMDNPNAEISEEGLVDWKGNTYEVKAVRPTLNVLAVALKKQTTNHEVDEPEEPETETEDDTGDGTEDPDGTDGD